ncbi:MAG: FUSC family protein [Actinomycetes bacterium]
MIPVLRDSLSGTLRAARARRRALGRAVAGPGRERDLLVQILKSALAAVLAWETARLLLHSPQPFFAPLAALVTVHVTVYGSFRVGVQRVLAVLAGVLLAFAAAQVLGVNGASLGLVLVLALFVGRWRRLGDEGLQVPITALLAMTVAGGTAENALQARVLDTLVGAAIGAVTNLVLMPPVHLRSARDSVASTASGVARLLRTVAAGLREDWDRDDAVEWLDRARRLDRLVHDARATLGRGRESLRLNPRRRQVDLADDAAPLGRAVDALEHVVIQCRSIATSLLEVADSPIRPAPTFLQHYASILESVAEAFDRLADESQGEEELATVRAAVRTGGDRWRVLRSRVQEERLREPDSLPTYGSLLVDVERILDELERADDALALSTP